MKKSYLQKIYNGIEKSKRDNEGLDAEKYRREMEMAFNDNQELSRWAHQLPLDKLSFCKRLEKEARKDMGISEEDYDDWYLLECFLNVAFMEGVKIVFDESEDSVTEWKRMNSLWEY